MVGIRIIDEGNYREALKCLPNVAGKKEAIILLDKMPIIDPETLPIVQELRKKLEQVTAERDAAVNDVQCLVIGKLKACDYCKHNNPYNFDCPMTKQFGYCGYWEWRGAVAENATAGNGGQNDD